MSIPELGMPASYHFSCASCGKGQSPRRMTSTFGRCRHCNASTWGLEVEFEVTEGNDLVNAGIAVALTAATGSIHLPKRAQYERVRFNFQDVPAEDALDLCSSQRIREAIHDYAQRRIGEDAQKHRDRIRQRGGECAECGALFVRQPHKEWTVEGYCSRVCFTNGDSRQQKPAAAGVVKPIAPAPARQPAAGRAKIQLTCQCGHSFAVPQMYAGTMRPCPDCGEKTLAE